MAVTDAWFDDAALTILAEPDAPSRAAALDRLAGGDVETRLALEACVAVLECRMAAGELTAEELDRLTGGRAQ